jgi:hypothetical protein
MYEIWLTRIEMPEKAYARAGRLTDADMRKVEHAVKVQLGLLDPALQTQFYQPEE